MSQAFWDQRETEGMDQDAIEALVAEQEVHQWTTTGCEVYRVLGKPFQDKGQWQARIGRTEPSRTSFLVTCNRVQFHLPENCPNGEL